MDRYEIMLEEDLGDKFQQYREGIQGEIGQSRAV